MRFTAVDADLGMSASGTRVANGKKGHFPITGLFFCDQYFLNHFEKVAGEDPVEDPRKHAVELLAIADLTSRRYVLMVVPTVEMFVCPQQSLACTDAPAGVQAILCEVWAR